jgi:peptidyl-prolyl cis-trans isomerase B (cyclophilin B)
VDSLKLTRVLLSFLCLACTKDPEPPPPGGKDATSESKPEKAPKTEVQTPAGFTEDSLRDLVHAPHGGDRALLFRLLSSDAAARRWAPLGLGMTCNESNAADTENRLLSAVATWLGGAEPPKADELRTAGWAIGVCAAPSAENVLRAWLGVTPATEKTGLTEAGVFGLGALADRKGTLSEQTQTALLEAASREKRAELLQPLGRIGRLSEAVGAHILEVTGSLLTQKERPGSRHAIFALGSAGPSAEGPLTQILLTEKYTPEERAAAAQALSRLGEVGQNALDKGLRDLLSRGLPTSYDRELWVPLRAVIDNLKSASESKPKLVELATLVLPEGSEREKSAQRRRLIWLRCEAARLLAQANFNFPALTSCDPEGGRDFHLAQIEVLGRDQLKGARKKEFQKALSASDPVVAQAALRLLASHQEVEISAEILENALKSGAPGTQATAAQLITTYPDRAHDKKDKEGPREGIVSALKELLVSDRSVASEARAAAIEAAGAVGALSLKPEIEKHCNGPAQALWDPARRALALLGNPKANCPNQPPTGTSALPSFSGEVTLVAETDVGELVFHLDGRDAPHSAAHFLKKVEEKFYDGLRVHGARAGFAVQFGDKDGDGYQDGPSEALPHEVSPRPFTTGSFGMSAFSPGSQDAQIFVILSEAPQLHGSRVHLGQVEGPFHLLVVGDVIHSLRRK